MLTLTQNIIMTLVELVKVYNENRMTSTMSKCDRDYLIDEFSREELAELLVFITTLINHNKLKKQIIIGSPCIEKLKREGKF